MSNKLSFNLLIGSLFHWMKAYRQQLLNLLFFFRKICKNPVLHKPILAILWGEGRSVMKVENNFFLTLHQVQSIKQRHIENTPLLLAPETSVWSISPLKASLLLLILKNLKVSYEMLMWEKVLWLNKFGKCSNIVEQVSLVHLRQPWICIEISNGSRNSAGKISQVELGGPHVAYRWTVELIKTEFQPQSIALHAFWIILGLVTRLYENQAGW